MSLSKPFPLQELPRLPFEHVLLQIYPLDLFFYALTSKRVRNLLKALKLVQFYDVNIGGEENYAEVAIIFKNNRKFQWRFVKGTYQDDAPHEKIDSFFLGDVEVTDCYQAIAADTIFTYIQPDLYLEKTYALADQLLSILPLPIRKHFVGYVGSKFDDDNVLFNWKTVQKCEELKLEGIEHKAPWFPEVMERIEVTRKIILNSWYLYKSDDSVWVQYEKVKNIKELEIANLALTMETFLEMHHEHLYFRRTSIDMDYTHEYWVKWMLGGFKKLKTLKVEASYNYTIEGIEMPLPEGFDSWPIIRFPSKTHCNQSPHRRNVPVIDNIVVKHLLEGSSHEGNSGARLGDLLGQLHDLLDTGHWDRLTDFCDEFGVRGATEIARTGFFVTLLENRSKGLKSTNCSSQVSFRVVHDLNEFLITHRSSFGIADGSESLNLNFRRQRLESELGASTDDGRDQTGHVVADQNESSGLRVIFNDTTHRRLRFSRHRVHLVQNDDLEALELFRAARQRIGAEGEL